ncbi:MAG: TolC family protein [Gemmatimonadota bacterium]
MNLRQGKALVVSAALVFALQTPVVGQGRVQGGELDSLIAVAVAHHPTLEAAQARVRAARARVQPSGSLPDPRAGIGVMNLPVNASGYDDMTMNTLIVGQMVPYPGRLRLQRELASAEVMAEEAARFGLKGDIERDVRFSYYDIVYAGHALRVLAHSQQVTIGLTQNAESRYATGAIPQRDILRLQAEAGRIAEEAAMVSEERRAAIARLSALLGGAAAVHLTGDIPETIKAAAVAGDPGRIRFVSADLGARVADSPLRSVPLLQQAALSANPELRLDDARIAAQLIRVRLAEQAHLPDFDVELQYGQRPSRSDMVSLMVSVPLPVRRASRQEQELAAARADLAALLSERAARVLELHADIAEVYSELEALRAQLALYVRSIIPQGRAAFESAASGYATGRAEFATLLESRSAIFEYEFAYERGLATFAKKLAELERLVGSEVLS